MLVLSSIYLVEMFMKNLVYLKKSLLMNAVALSVLSFPANAVTEDVVKAYWVKKCGDTYCLDSDTLLKLMPVNDSQWQQFRITVSSLIPENTDGYTLNQVITALGQANPDTLLHGKFIPTVQAFIPKDADGYTLNQVITALGQVNPDILFHGKFIPTAQAFIPEGMDPHSRYEVITALGQANPDILFHKTLIPIAQLFVRKDIYGYQCAHIIKALDNVETHKIDRVYFQIQNLRKATEGKVQLEEAVEFQEFIWKLTAFETDIEAQTFTDTLVSLVNAEQKFDSDRLVILINTTFDRMGGNRQNELNNVFQMIRGGVINASRENAQDIPSCWMGLITSMVQARLTSMLGTLMLSEKVTYPDALIFKSFRALMQEISQEEHDDKFNRQVDMARSCVGPYIKKNREFMEIIEGVTSKRRDRRPLLQTRGLGSHLNQEDQND